MRILVGSVVNQRQDVLKAFLNLVQQNADEADASVEYAWIVDPTAPDENAEILPGMVEEGSPKPDDSSYAKTERTTNWDSSTFSWLAEQRQRLLDLARDNHYDAIWLVDTDLLCEPGTLQSLIDAQQAIVSAVFWTRWQPQSPPLPNVWLQGDYGLDGRGWEEWEFLTALADRKLVEVFGLGACTLIRTDVLDRVRYAPLVEGLPEGGMWGGEDRSFCLRAERNHIGMFADPFPDIFHAYRPSDSENLDEIVEFLEARGKPTAEPGDLVSLTIEPLEEPRLGGHIEHVRGVFGTLGLLPEIRETLRDLPVGESALVRAEFPPWSKIEEYRGKQKTFRVRLLGSKTNLPPINTKEHEGWMKFRDSSMTPRELTLLRETTTE